MRRASISCVYLSPFFFPEPISTGKYNTAVMEGLRDSGMNTTVITSEPLYPDWVPQKTDRTIPDVEIVRGGSWISYPKSPLLRRLVLELWFACFMAYELPRRRKSTDAVIAVFPPVLFLPMAKMLLRKDVQCIGIVHDLQSVFVQKSASPKRRMIAGIVRWLEGTALKSCQRLIFLSHSMAAKAIEQHGLDPQRCTVHFPFSTSPAKGEGRALIDYFPPGLQHVVYAGALGEKQNPEGLIECFTVLTHAREDIVCHCFSRGPTFDDLKGKYGQVPRLKFHDLVEERDLSELMDRSALQIVPQLFGTSEAAIPSKLPNLIAAGVPVLAICDEASETGKIVMEAQAGAVVHSWAPITVASAATKLLDATRDQSRESRRAKAAKYVEEHFNLQRLVNDIVSFAKRAPKEL